MNSIKNIGLLVIFIVIAGIAKAQSFKFGFVTDTHIGSVNAAEDLCRTVQDINADTSLRFVVITGDITEFGSDNELQLAKQILDSLNKKWYVIPGNHDGNWSESGGNSFRKVFGAETFSFIYGGYLFVATNSGPNMRMGPGQVPRENLVWLDSVLNNMKKPDMPVIYLNHYPQDSSLNNWYEAIDRLKKRNIQLILLGHGHANRSFNFEGIQGVMGRSNLRAKDSIGGYNIVTIQNNLATFEERKPILKTQRKWTEAPLFDHHFEKDTTRYPRPSYAINQKYLFVKKVWEYQDQSDIGAGTAYAHKLVIATNTNGDIFTMNIRTGKRKWSFHADGKIYSTPAVAGNYVIAGSTDNHIYCLSLKTGKVIWKATAQKPVLASPVIKNDIVYIGGSDNHFRALYLKNGNKVWDFDRVNGFVVTRPLIYEGKIYFGCWNNDFYALDLASGNLVWKWNNKSANRMFSPAACVPVATQGRLFIVAPDRYMTSLDAANGNVIWRKQRPDVHVRESMGLSSDSTMVYVKTMEGQLYGISTTADSMSVSWKSSLQLPYELNPTAIIEHKGIVYVPSHSGMACAVDRRSGKVLWEHKISNCLVNMIMPFKKNQVIVSSMDGKITCLKYSPK
ncbi:MAG: PQQ-binding-like beta-propeller repeat protein [Bacteroidota bacterium]|nr:PQQ-binding-like beta-propeller repeat protein [Bacteroidota bacterium]